MFEETWKYIDGYSGYLVSSEGRVMSLHKVDSIGRERDGVILKPRFQKNGYAFVSLCDKGEVNQERIHLLVAKAFVPNPWSYKEVNHIDGDKANNRAENLEWCTRSENNKHAVSFGLRDLKFMHECACKKNMKPVAKIPDGEIVAVYHLWQMLEKRLGQTRGT